MKIFYFIFFLLIIFGFLIGLFFLEIKPRILITKYKNQFLLWLSISLFSSFFIHSTNVLQYLIVLLLLIHSLTDLIERNLFTFVSFCLLILGFFRCYIEKTFICCISTVLLCFFLCVILRILFYNRSFESLIGFGDVILLCSMIPFFDWFSYIVFIGLASLYGCLYVLSRILFDFFICFFEKKKITYNSEFSVPFAPFILIAYSTYSYIVKVIV